MTTDLLNDPRLASLLAAAKLCPEEDGPRLVLADWLDDRGDPARAEFVRLQLRLAPGSIKPDEGWRAEGLARCRQLLDRHGGAWLGPLWRGSLPPLVWHRGLLALRVP